MDEQRTFEELVDRAVERLLDGEAVEAILASYPAHAAGLAPVLQSAGLLMTAPRSHANAAGRTKAMRRMLDQLEATGVGTRSGGGIMSIFKSFRGRPLAFQGLAAASALVVFGALGLGASAATGTTPEPVRDLLGIASNSTIHVEFTGTIVSVEPGAGTLTVSANGDIRTVTVNDSTDLADSGDAITLNDLAAGQTVEVEGTLQPDNSIIAAKVHIEDPDDAPPAATPGVNVPTAAPTFDDHGGDRPDGQSDDGPNDDQGEDGDHQGEDGDHQGEDNSGPGSADDDAVEDEHEDNSGPGSGDAEERDDDHGDDATDDNSGSGSDDSGRDHEEDNSGSGSGDDSGGE